MGNGSRPAPLTRGPLKLPAEMLPAQVQRASLAPQCYAYRDLAVEGEQPQGSRHLHWTVVAFQAANPDDGAMIDSVTVHIEAEDEPAALREAARIVRRNLYRVSAVQEDCTLTFAKAQREVAAAG